MATLGWSEPKLAQKTTLHIAQFTGQNNEMTRKAGLPTLQPGQRGPSAMFGFCLALIAADSVALAVESARVVSDPKHSF